MKKNIIISVGLIIVTFVLLPLATVFLIGGMDAMGILLLLLVTLNPIISIVVGILSGGKKVLWYMPIISSLVFLIAESILTGFDFIYVIAAAIYFGFGIAAAYIAKALKKKKTVDSQ